MVDYGPLSNKDLLLTYGFILNDNPHDNFQLTIQKSTLKRVEDYIINSHYDRIYSTPKHFFLQKNCTNGTLQLLAWERVRNINFNEVPNFNFRLPFDFTHFKGAFLLDSIF